MVFSPRLLAVQVVGAFDGEVTGSSRVEAVPVLMRRAEPAVALNPTVLAPGLTDQFGNPVNGLLNSRF